LVEKFNYKIIKLITSAAKVTNTSKNKFKKTNKIKTWVTNGLLIFLYINRQKLYKKKLKSPFDLKQTIVYLI
jgi:hypothetical protein